MSNNAVVPYGSSLILDVIKGNLIICRNASVKGKGVSPKVTVLGFVKCSDGVVLQCSLFSDNFEGRGDTVIQGDLEVKNRIKMTTGHLSVIGKLKAKIIDLTDEGDLTVGGSIQVNDIRARDIDAGGSFTAFGEVEVKKLTVKGSAKIKGGHVKESRVGGSFDSHGSFKFELINVEGAIKMIGKNSGGDITVRGYCRVDGKLRFGAIHAGGGVEISGAAIGDSLTTGGILRVGSFLQLSGKLEVGGHVDIEAAITAQEVLVRGNLRAKALVASGNVKVGGSIITVSGVVAHSFETSRRSEVKGRICANQVIIGDEAIVEDVYAKSITMGERSSARNMYGERINIESGAHINGEIRYTEHLQAERDVYLGKNPREVGKLPQ
jgi:cytoskeletal protein CcmA (bactofilin family)